MNDSQEQFILNQKAFESWLNRSDERIEQLHKYLPSTVASKLDFTAESLTVLETWLLAQYESHTPLVHDENFALLDQLITYVGETYRRHIPEAFWDINFEDERMADYGQPRIKSRFVYHRVRSAITRALFKRTGCLLESSIKQTIEYEKAEWEKLQMKKKEEKSRESNVTIKSIDRISYHSHLFVFESITATQWLTCQQKLIERFKKLKGTILSDDGRLYLQINEWQLVAVLRDATKDDEVVNLLAHALSAKHVSSENAAASCQAAVEIYAAHDPDMVHFNDYVTVIEVLEAQFPSSLHVTI